MKLYSKILGKAHQELIIIHGLFGMSDNWITLAKKFSLYFKVHVLDLRNHGRSPHSSNFNYQSMAEDIKEYIDFHSINSPIILGHSLGGKVAMKLAFMFPDSLSKLIVADIAPKEYETQFHQNLLRILNSISLEKYNSRSEISSSLFDDIPNQQVRDFLLKNLYRKKDKFCWRLNIETLIKELDNIKEASFINGVCDVESYFIKGKKSDYITEEDSVLIKTHFSNVQIKTVENAGHWLHAENPKAFFEQVLSCI